MDKRFVLVGPNRDRIIFRPHKKREGYYMVNNQPFPVEEARGIWRALRSEGYFWGHDYPGEGYELSELESDQDLGYDDPVAAGHDGLDSEYWSAVGENADLGDHWG